MKEKTYIAIDLKSFYASVECVDRGLDPLTTNLVVADASKTEKTICLAVTPSLKALGIPGRARLFEVIQKVRQENSRRKRLSPSQSFSGKSSDSTKLSADPSLAIDFIVAPPRMSHYMDVSANIYKVYLKYVAPEDIHVYSIDEVFIDATSYLGMYKLTAKEFAMRIIRDVLKTTGITATAGIGENLYLCKVAMDIEAKHIPPDENGVRIAELNEASYRKKLWSHRPLTDFWRVGKGYAAKLEANGIYTMGDVARCSIYNESLLYDLFGVNAELLIDHAWGWEPCTIRDIRAYKPESNSIGSGQVLPSPYSFEKGRLIVREMTDLLVLDLVEKGLVTSQIVLTVGYDSENLDEAIKSGKYSGPVTKDHYGRKIPKSAHGTVNLAKKTSSTRIILDAVTGLYERIVNKDLSVRRMYVTATHVTDESAVDTTEHLEQLDLFSDYEAIAEKRAAEE